VYSYATLIPYSQGTMVTIVTEYDISTGNEYIIFCMHFFSPVEMRNVLSPDKIKPG